MPAIAGECPALVRAAAKVGLAHIMARFASLAGSASGVSAAFKTYVAALIDHQRLACLKQQRAAAPPSAVMLPADSKSDWDVFAPQNAGLYPIEMHEESRFRWSEPAAMMPVWMNEGRHRIRIECMPFRRLARASLRFYVNGRPLPAQDVLIRPDAIDITFNLPKSGHCTFGWTCLRFRAKGDSRWLGLPIKRIVRKTDAQLSGLKTVAIAES